MYLERIFKMLGFVKPRSNDPNGKQDILTAGINQAIQRNEQAGAKVRETLLELLTENDRVRRAHNENNHT